MIILRRISDSFINRILHNNNQRLLTALIQFHYGLNIFLLMRGLHKYSYDQLKKAQNVLSTIMFGYFN